LDGYYYNGIDNACAKCNYTCKSCSSATSCDTCLSLNIRTLNSSSCPCNEGYYDNNKEALCEKCDYSCISCSGNDQSCDSCTSSRILKSNTCPCRDGYIENLSNPSVCL
jgi:hypothetical protein